MIKNKKKTIQKKFYELLLCFKIISSIIRVYLVRVQKIISFCILNKNYSSLSSPQNIMLKVFIDTKKEYYSERISSFIKTSFIQFSSYISLIC